MQKQVSRGNQPPALADRDVWIFDLDNTLYPPESNLFTEIDKKLGAFIADLLQVDRTEARRIQKLYFKEYGTTLNGLMNVHNIDPGAFLDYVHDIDHSAIKPDPELEKALRKLPGSKYIFTNGTVSHAENVLERLGITNFFIDIFDIRTTEYIPKPHPEAYQTVVSKANLSPQRSVMFEDLPRNLQVPNELGMMTVWVRSDVRVGHMEASLIADENQPFIDFVTENLTEFLEDECIA